MSDVVDAAIAEYLLGTDWSYWQGVSDVLVADSRGVAFFFFRATRGPYYVDPRFAEFRQQAEDNNFIWGPYHYFIPAYDPIQQARHFYNTVGEYTGLPPVVDFEQTSGLSQYQLNLRLRLFIQEVTRLFGRKPIIYTRGYFWNYWIYRAEDWKDYPLWVAHYTTAASPYMPSDWSVWTFWQYSADGNGLGAYYGVSSHSVDLDRANLTLQELQEMAGHEVTPPPPPPAPSERYFEAYVYARGLNVRSGPGLSNPSVRFLSHGDKVKVYAHEYNAIDGFSWAKISDTEEEWSAIKWMTMEL